MTTTTTFDERGVLKDGRTLRVSMMDAADLPKVRDADGGPLGQPGFTTRDASGAAADKFRDTRNALYDEYDAEISSQWKNTGVGK